MIFIASCISSWLNRIGLFQVNSGHALPGACLVTKVADFLHDLQRLLLDRIILALFRVDGGKAM